MSITDIYNKSTILSTDNNIINNQRSKFHQELIKRSLSMDELKSVIKRLINNYIHGEYNILDIESVNLQTNDRFKQYYIVFSISTINKNNYPLLSMNKAFIHFSINLKSNNNKLHKFNNNYSSYNSIIDYPMIESDHNIYDNNKELNYMYSMPPYQQSNFQSTKGNIHSIDVNRIHPSDSRFCNKDHHSIWDYHGINKDKHIYYPGCELDNTTYNKMYFHPQDYPGKTVSRYDNTQYNWLDNPSFENILRSPTF